MRDFLAFRDLRLSRLGAMAGGGAEPAHPPVIVGNSATIVSGGVTYTLSNACDYGYDQIGHAFVVPVPGLTIVSRSPAATTAETFAVNGTMKNPMRGNAQGWDGRLDNYSAGLNVGFPIAVAAGDIVVGQIHDPATLIGDSGPFDPRRSGVSLEYSPIYFVSTGWGANAIAPSPIGWTGRGTPTPYYVDCLAAAAAFPTKDIAAMSPTALATLQGRIRRTEIALGMTYNTSATGGYQGLTTRNKTGAASNYGEYQATMYAEAGLEPSGNRATVAEKAEILAWQISAGINMHDPAVGSGDFLGGDGGQYQFHFMPVAMALHFTGQTAALANLVNTMPGSQLEQSFFYTSDQVTQLDGHADLAKAFTARERAITGVSGLNITFATDQGGATTGDLPKFDVLGGRMIRPSDGASALVTVHTDVNTDAGTGTMTVTIDAQPVPPFATSDVIRFKQGYNVAVGDPGWKSEAYDSANNPMVTASYRNGNNWAGGILALRGVGAWHSSFDAAEQYVVIANIANYPSAAEDFPSHNANAYITAFWNAYAASLIGNKPTFLERPTITGTAQEDETLTAVSAPIGGTATITKTWQWLLNGVAISGATGATYTVLTGDIGGKISVKQTATNGLGVASLTSLETLTVVAASNVGAVEFDGTNDWLHAAGMSAPAASKQGALVMTFYVPGNWPHGPYMFAGRRTTSARTSLRAYRDSTGSPPTTQGRLDVSLRDSGGSTRGSLTTANGTFLIAGYYTVAISWNTATQTWVFKKRPGGGSWSTVAYTGTPSLTLDALIDTTPDAIIGAETSAGVNLMTDWYCSEVWFAPGQLPDFNDPAILAKCLPSYVKGADGSGITGTAPLIYLAGATATFHENKSGVTPNFTVVGALTDAPSLPT